MSIKLLIVGGVAGGASAAARARRLDENAEIILFERGEFVSFANCGLPYHIGEEIKDRANLLVSTPQMLKDRFKIDVRTFQEVVSIDRDKKQVKVKDLSSDTEYFESYDKLILSPGAKPIKPPIPGIDLQNIFTLRNIPDMDKIIKQIKLKEPKNIVVVGGGFIGVEMAENLTRLGIDTTIVEMLDQVMPPFDYEMAVMIHRQLIHHKVKLHLGDGVKSFEKQGDSLLVKTQGGAEIPCDMVILSIGVTPENRLAKDAGLELGERGAIKTDETMRTSDPDIFAIGDAAEVKDFVNGQPSMIPLAGPANKQGRIAADNALGRRMVYKGTQGTSVVKVFNLTAASTGNNEKTLKRLGIPYLASYNHSSSHASYYPHSRPLSIKLLFSPKEGKILGAQIIGEKGADKRIDVLATAIRAGMTVFDLEELELAYAPPYSSAKDPVNMAGFIAANILRGDVKTVKWDEIDGLDLNTHTFLDVREPVEVSVSGLINDAVNIPLHSLRDNLDKIDKSKKVVIYCASGLRSYVASRILTQKGFDAYNLSGGWKTYSIVHKQQKGEVEKMTHKEEEVKESSAGDISPDIEIDARALQCPGPILKIKEAMDSLEKGQTLKIIAADPGFPSDVQAWCRNTGNRLLVQETTDEGFTALICKGDIEKKSSSDKQCGEDMTLILFSDDLDRALAAFILANGAASLGKKVNMFFTFWGLNVLKKKGRSSQGKDVLSTMFGAMMPKGPEKLALSKMHFAGLGTSMMKYVMDNKNVESLDALMKGAIKQGVTLTACTMTMDIMGIKKEELIDGIREGGVASYLDSADSANINLFI